MGMMHLRTLALLGSLFFMMGCGSDPKIAPTRESRPETVTPTETHAGRAYVSSFQSGKLTAIDLGNGRVLGSIAVDDGAGSIGCAATRDGRTFFVTDGAHPARLRIFDASTFASKGTFEFENRQLQLGMQPVTELTEDERRLVIGTFDYKTLKTGAITFDRETQTFAPETELHGTRISMPHVKGLEHMLGPMDDPMEVGRTVWMASTPNQRLRVFAHGTHVWFVDRKTRTVIGSARLPGFAHDAWFTHDYEQLVTYVDGAKALVAISATTFETRVIPISIPRNGPVDFIVAASP